MKQKTKMFLRSAVIPVILLALLSATSCKKDNSNDNSTSNGAVTVIQDTISGTQTWSANKQYLLKGWVYVVKGAKLTIEAGTVIKGDKDTKAALIVEPGAQIFAQGTVDKPIVFTSNRPTGVRTYGDWGGLILCGKAPVNTVSNGVYPIIEGGPRTHYGGTDAHDNSGTLQYVRVEFAGIAFAPDNEINGVTFGGVGDGTTVDHVEVSYSGDDSFEWFGGTVNCKYLVSHRAWDDDFDTDSGFSGNIQFAVAIRDPYSADASGSKGFESDNMATGAVSAPGLPTTSAVFSNVTLVGPLVSATSTAYSSNFVAAVHLRRNTSISIFNSIIVGWPTGILVDDPNKSQSGLTIGSTSGNIAAGVAGTTGVPTLVVKNVIIAGIPTTATGGQKNVFYVYNGAGSLTSTTTMGDTLSANAAWGAAVGPLTWFNKAGNGNKIYATTDAIRLQNPFNLTNPNFVPTTSSPIVNSQYPDPNNPNTQIWHNPAVPAVAASFTDSKVSGSFFTQVGYVGAFAGTQTTSDDWTSGWCDFDPENTTY